MVAGFITTTANNHGDMSVQQQPITWRQDLPHCHVWQIYLRQWAVATIIMV